MTILTRRARVFFATRKPSPRRVWMRGHSSVWQHFDPSPRSRTLCRSCGHVIDHGPTHGGPIPVVNLERHNIGFVSIAGKRFDKWCDGTETEAV